MGLLKWVTSKIVGRQPTVEQMDEDTLSWNIRDGKLYGKKISEGGVEEIVEISGEGGGGGGVDTFLELTDTPASYTGQAGKAAVVNEAENAIEFVDMPEGGGGVLVYREFPSGDINGVNTEYELTEQPNNSSLIFLFVNGVYRQDFTYDFASKTITIDFAPETDSEVFVQYFVAATVGVNGLSAYELDVLNGFTGTIEEWFTSLGGNVAVHESTYNHGSFASAELAIAYAIAL